ncbi:thermonuclease family protein [Cryobacterium zhongshanensis]|uniref:Thermonuclease family protein n=1 Tax=Cryobacterium zhongshanensis TaxID=2928153 RepID=A0AA41UM68_9MICO|nr:thermonuclease family protein [Cryobacterium zhongshanensis]MCI4659541.1 thermonuclease family protein [Cryobacterium zhongshanensis]
MRRTKTFITAAAVLTLTLSLTGCQAATQAVSDLVGQAQQQSDTQAASPSEKRPATLRRIVDGDTITVEPSTDFPATDKNGTEHTIRLLGIDTPELNKMSGEEPECGAQEAANYLGDIVHAGEQVTVVFDARSDHTDRFGRSLAYLELSDGTDLAHTLVVEGFAEAWYPPSEPAPERYSSYASAEQASVAANVGQHAFCATIGR